MSEVVQLRGLRVRYPGTDRWVLDGVDLTIEKGARVGIQGRSGSGKSTLAWALAGALPRGSEVEGTIRVGVVEVTELRGERLRQHRREVVGFVFQDPVATLNPVRTIGDQLREMLELAGEGEAGSAGAVRRGLDEVGLDDPDRVADAYPHELSGGMAQRVGVAMALIGSPQLLIADEPTTALDTVTQAGVLGLLRSVCEERRTAALVISHDPAVLSSVCDRVVRIVDGRAVEAGR